MQVQTLSKGTFILLRLSRAQIGRCKLTLIKKQDLSTQKDEPTQYNIYSNKKLCHIKKNHQLFKNYFVHILGTKISFCRCRPKNFPKSEVYFLNRVIVLCFSVMASCSLMVMYA